MDHKDSIAHKAHLRLIKLAVIFTLTIISSFLFISLYFIRMNRIEDFNIIISQTMNEVFNFELKSNYELIIKKIQKKTSLRELAVYDSSCKLKAFSSLSMAIPECPYDSPFVHTRANIGEEVLNIFYDPKFSFSQAIKENMTAIAVITLVTLLITMAGLLFFLKESFLRPLDLIQKQLTNDSFSLPKEFNFIASKLTELKLAISNHEREKANVELARRVVHDIRNPLAFLKMNLNEQKPDIYALKLKVDEISYQVSNLLGGTKKDPSGTILHSFLTSLESELKYVFSMSVHIDGKTQNVLLKINEFDLNNIFFNLVKNSKEAGATAIHIVFHQSTKAGIFSVTDNGHGVPQNVRERIFQKNLTSKKNGNGIGLSNLKEFLSDVGGDLNFDHTFKCGARFIIEIPIQDSIPDEVIFIDNDKYLRLGWISSGQKAGVKVHTFKSVADFLQSSQDMSPNIPVYIDSDLDEEKNGELLAEKIYLRGFRSIFLATSFHDIDLTPYPWLKGLASKEPPFLLSHS